MLSGGLPAFVAPEYDPGLGMAHGVTPESLAAALEAAPEARAAFIVSPTYYGMAADVAGCAQVAHDAGVPLIVDQSWGPHLGFHDALPPSALAQGADAVLTSTHKLAGSLTQSAMLHLGPGDRIDEVAVARAVRIVRSTSPSSLLLASLDAARRQLAVHGEQLLHETLGAIEQAREKLRSIDGVELIDDGLAGRPGVAAYDPLRIVLDVRGTGRTGVELAAALRETLRHPRRARHDGDDRASSSASPSARETLLRAAGDVEEVVGRLRRDGARRRRSARRRASPSSPSRRATRSSGAPRSSHVDAPSGGSRASRSPATRRASRRSCRASASPRRSSPTCARASPPALRLHGASDPAFETMHVLAED